MRILLQLLAVATTASAFKCDHDAYLERDLEQGKYNLIHTTRILYPKTPGKYPVFTFLHGFMLTLQTYDQVLCEAAKNNIVICLQMKERLLSEGLEDDANSLLPYLHDKEKGILPRIGAPDDQILPGYSYSHVGIGGHSRGGGVIAYAYSHNIVGDDDFTGVAFIDPVVMKDSDVPNVVSLKKTKVRALFFNDPQSMCVTKGWPNFGDKFASSKDITVKDGAAAAGCKHMDVLSSWGSLLPLCHSNNGDACKKLAREDIAAAGFGSAVLGANRSLDFLTV